MSATASLRVLVLGGNGYVGQSICAAAVSSSRVAAVQSLSRSGEPGKASTPPHLAERLSEVEFLRGDVFDAKRRMKAFSDVDVVISTIGAFGSNEFMERACGDATIEAAKTAGEVDVSRFGFVSSAQVGRLTLRPGMPMYGYFHGKERAEGAIRKSFPDAHVILRPGFIYGPRAMGPLGMVPLQYIGSPISFVGTKMGPISSLLQSVPFVGTECSSMVHVDGVANAMVDTITREEIGALVLNADEIRAFE